MKTISMRIRSAKSELEDAGESTDGMVESTATLREEIMALSGVDIMASATEFKSTYQILDELSEKWESLSDISQATIVEKLAGKHQGNVFASLMENFNTARDALETSLNSSGSALAEHSKWSQSLEARLLSLKAAWQSLSQSFMDSDFLRGAMDAIIGLVDGITTLIDTFGTLPTLIGAFAAFESLQGVGLFDTIKDEATGAATGITSAFEKIKVAIDNVKNDSTISFDTNFADALAQDQSSLQMYEAALNSGMSAQEAFSATMQNASPAAQQYAKTVQITGESIQKFADQQKMSELSMKAQDKSWANCSRLINSYNSSMRTCGLTQEQFLNSIQASNPALHKYLSGLDGANGTFKGYITSLVGAKVATFALEAATLALNAAITMGISALVSFAIKAFDEMYESADELAERIDEVITKFNDQQKELVKNKASFKSDAERYVELSKGVDSLGRNISLTTEEYSEYQSVVNSVAEQIPSLVSGYDSQGNAILNVKGNVEELIAAYDNLIKAQNNELIANTKSINDEFENAVDDNEFKTEGWFGWDWTQKLNMGKEKLSTESAKIFKDILNSEDAVAAFNEAYREGFTDSDMAIDIVALSDLLAESGFDKDGLESSREHVERAFEKDRDAVKMVLDQFYADLEKEIDGKKSLSEAILSNALDLSDSAYRDMNDTLKNVARQIVNGFDYEFFAGLKADGISVEDYINNMLGQLDSISDVSNNKIETAFNLKTQFNDGEISYGEYVKGLEDTGKLIDGLSIDEELKTQLKLSIGLNEAGIVDEYQNLVNKLSDHTNYDFDARITSDVAKAFLGSLSAEELSVAVGIITEMSDNDVEESIQDIRDAINRKMAVEGLTFDLNFEVETASIDAFNTALSESVTASGLSSESISALKGRYAELENQGYDLSAMFEETSNGIHLNRKAVGELERAYAKQKQTDITADLQSLQKEYDLLTKDIDNCNDASERASLYVQRDAIAQQINDAATLAAQYQGLTSAYNDWLAAEEAGQERDMYENIIEGLENIDDEISRGWLDDGTIEFLELLTGKDLSTSSIDDLTAAYKGLNKEIGNSGYSIRDFFTVNEDGDSTNTGVYNFLETIESFEKLKGAIQRDKETGEIESFNFSVVGGDQAIAEALGISEELVQIMVRAADDAGFVVTLDGAYTQLADLKASAEEANDTLKKLGKTDVDFNFGAKSLEDLNSELGKATEVLEQFRNKDGTINMEMDGAEEALEIASYFTATIDKLTEPIYMQLETNQVEKDLQEPLTKMQEFERLAKQKHQFELTGDTEDLEKVEAEMDEIATYLDGLDEETQIKLGIDGLSMEEIKGKLEKGEIEIPATVDIQLEMSEDIRDMRLMMMNQLGLISDEQLKLEIEYDIDSSAIENYTPEQQKAIVEYFVKHDEVDNYTPKEKEALVKFIAESGNLDEYTPEEKQAIVEYLTDSGDPDSWTPEQKEAVAKFKKDSSEVDGYTPEQKEAIAKYIKNSEDPDNYQPDNKDATVTYEKDSTAVDSYNPPNLSRKVFYDIIENVENGSKNLSNKGGSAADKRTGENLKPSGANGTANADGTIGRAFKQGSWGTKNSGTALVGELGRETLVRDGRYYTIGDNGAEFIKYRKGDIVFNHKQTEELFNNGRVTSGGGRAKALASGTAFAEGTAFSLGTGGGLGKIEVSVKDGSGKKTDVTVKATGAEGKDGGLPPHNPGNNGGKGAKGGGGGGGGSKSKDETKETFDWIEVAIDRIERAIDKLDRKVNSVFKSWSERNAALANELSKVQDEIELQQEAYERYIQEANSVGLSADWAEKVRNGEIDIETITDEDLAEKIKEYQKWYEAAIACQDAIDELREKEAELYKQRFEHASAQYEGILGVIEHEKNMLEEYIAQNEANAQFISEEYYKALMNNEAENIGQLEQQKAAMIAELEAALASGTIAYGSEAYYEMVAAIDEITLAIAESQTAMMEYEQIIQQLSWEVFDLLQEKISAITDEADFLIELLSNDKLHGDNGQLTDEGMATMGLHGQKYNTYMYQADLVAQEIERLKAQLEEDPNDTELQKRYQEMIALQQEYILAAEEEKQAMIDLVKEGIELELDALQERIDKYNESIDAAKDLYEYNKRIKEQAAEIASLEKQMAAYAGDDSEEARAKIQELKVSLEEAKTELQETEYDKYISDQQQLLDELYLEYEEILNMRLDNIDALISNMIEEINANAGAISSTISGAAESVGHTLPDAMSATWTTSTADINNVLTTYGDRFVNAQTTTNNALSVISTNLQNVINQLNAIAKTDVKAASESSEATGGGNPPAPSPPSNAPTSAPASVPIKIGGKINARNAQIYDYAGDTSGERQLYRNDPIYKVLRLNGNWVQVRWHKLTSGVTGWFKKGDVKAYKNGARKIDDDDVAWTQEGGQEEYIVRPSDGAILTPVAKSDSVLNAEASGNIWNMANAPAEFIRDNLKLGVGNVPTVTNTQGNYTQNLENVVFSFPNVQNYDEMLRAMQNDKNFERLVSSMTVDRLAGGSALAKGKSIR